MLPTYHLTHLQYHGKQDYLHKWPNFEKWNKGQKRYCPVTQIHCNIIIFLFGPTIQLLLQIWETWLPIFCPQKTCCPSTYLPIFRMMKKFHLSSHFVLKNKTFCLPIHFNVHTSRNKTLVLFGPSVTTNNVLKTYRLFKTG